MTIQSYYQMQITRFKHNRPVVRKALMALGCKTVACDYDGSGDEGSVHAPEYKPAIIGQSRVKNILSCRWNSKEPEPGEEDIEEATHNIFYDALDQTHGGWEINDGARGEIVWNLTTDLITIEHCAYYIEEHHTGTEL